MVTEDDNGKVMDLKLSDIIKKYDESNHQKLETSLRDYVGYFKKIYEELDMEWTAEDSLKVSGIFDAILERAKLDAIQILLSSAEGKEREKSCKNEVHDKFDCMKQ
ncbi:MAG: hypothetical protein NKF70_03070 [Methanobacterium sp. ERen5]|nr:MAG: hypothetical protein NKF70_03070 [Methanobacterium sp. ERen5]